MVASNAIRALLVVFAPLCLLPGPVWLGLPWGYWGLVGMTFLESILTQFFALEQATIPVVVPGDHLLAANSLTQATSMGATILASPWVSRSFARCTAALRPSASMAASFCCFLFVTASPP